MKRKTDKQMWEKKTQNQRVTTEVDNEVHPLHWATSSSPSPMGTDPINLFKMVQKWFWNQLQQLQTKCCTKALRPLFW